jgi:hypothetical protein
MKTWKKRNWLSCECCGINGALEVLTDASDDTVCDGEAARCINHSITGVVKEYCGGYIIEWDEDDQESNVVNQTLAR